MKKISANQLYSLLNANMIELIDIRDSQKFLRGHISKSINIPYRYLLSNPNSYLNKQSMYALICDYGITSDDAAYKLSNQGYNVVSVIKGIGSWNYGLIT